MKSAPIECYSTVCEEMHGWHVVVQGENADNVQHVTNTLKCLPDDMFGGLSHGERRFTVTSGEIVHFKVMQKDKKSRMMTVEVESGKRIVARFDDSAFYEISAEVDREHGRKEG